MASLNYHHLRYFWVIANEQHLSRAAERLHVSQSALSIQLKKPEDSLGRPLFEREDKRLALTEAGRIALDYANTLFRTGEELTSLFRNRPSSSGQILCIGAVATLSRNFRIGLLRPWLARGGLQMVIHSGSLKELLAEFDDMAMLRLLARDADALALVPPVVVQDELRAGILVEVHRVAEISERFYAITPSRRFPNPVVRELVAGAAEVSRPEAANSGSEPASNP
jgi:DNA-binding transcriptional LysR family regulator